MKSKFLLIPLLLLLLTVSGCSTSKDPEQPQFLDVQLLISPEKAKVTQTVSFQAKVTFGGKEVNDADVSFEIWRSKDEQHEKIKVDNVKKGIYTLQKTFKQEGTYYVYSHVTAEGMHSMPKKEFVVGKPSEPEKESSMDMGSK